MKVSNTTTHNLTESVGSIRMTTSLVCRIDLGTRNSLCAVSYENTQELVTFGISKTSLSSIVWYYTNGDIFVGYEGSS